MLRFISVTGDFMKPDLCQHCGEYLGYKTGEKYCSNACKQKAYRARLKAEKAKPLTFGETPKDDRTPTEKAIDTKRNEQRWKTCPQCWEEFPVNGLQKGRRYCSDSCKQAHYRARNAWKAERQSTNPGAPTEIIPVTDNISKIVTEAWSDLVDD